MKKFIFLTLCIATASQAQDQNSHHAPNQYSGYEKTYFSDDATFSSMRKLVAPGADDQAGAHKLFDLVCNGSSPRIKISRKVNFKPKLEYKMAVDKSTVEIQHQIDMAKFYFKNDFFYRSGEGKDISEHVLTHSYVASENDPSSSNYVGADDYSSFEWKNVQHAVDMYMLMGLFTYRIPQSRVSEMYGTKEDSFRINKFGYQKGNFVASEAVTFKDYLWHYVLIHDTQVKEAPQSDGTTAFEVTWTPDLFCKYAVPIDDLKN